MAIEEITQVIDDIPEEREILVGTKNLPENIQWFASADGMPLRSTQINTVVSQMNTAISQTNTTISEVNEIKTDVVNAKNIVVSASEDAVNAKISIESYVIPTEATYSYEEIDNLDTLPSQTDNDGKFLSTDGTTAYWIGLPITATPTISISTSVNESASANGTITNYDSDATYTITANNGSIVYIDGNTFTYTAPDITDGDDDTDTISIYATKAGELRSEIADTAITVVYVPNVADDTIQVVDFTSEASFNDGFDIV